MGLKIVLVVACAVLSGVKKPPTPSERIKTLRAEQATKHVRLGSWAMDRHLEIDARGEYRIAVHLNPDCRTARSHLRDRRTRDGKWDESHERHFADGKGAEKKYGAEFATREQKRVAEEAAAFEKLGLELKSEGHPKLARKLLLHAYFLAPNREKTARGLGLVPLVKGFGTSRDCRAVGTYTTASAHGSKWVGPLTGTDTVVRHCGVIDAEVSGSADAAGRVAVLAQRAVALTACRFGIKNLPPNWMLLAVTQDPETFNRFLARVGIGGADAAVARKLGTLRLYQPRHCFVIAGNIGVGPSAYAPVFLHVSAEDTLCAYVGQDTPPWLFESVAVDASLVLSGNPGTVCVVVEQSQGLVTKGSFEDPSTWPAILVRRAASGDLPKLQYLKTAQIQALGIEDVVAAHAYYQLLLLTRRKGLAKYVKLMAAETPEEKAFKEAFGATHTEITKELVRVLLGG